VGRPSRVQAKGSVVGMLLDDLYRLLDRNGFMETNTRFLFAPRGSPALLDDDRRRDLWARIAKMRKNAMIYTVATAVLIFMQGSAAMATEAATGHIRSTVFLMIFGAVIIGLGLRTLWGTARHLEWLGATDPDAAAAAPPAAFHVNESEP